jgi:hypothetical protein
MLVATLTPKGKSFTEQFKKNYSLCGKHGHISAECYSRPRNTHNKPGYDASEKALAVTTSPPALSSITCNYCQKFEHTEKQCYKMKNKEGQSNDLVNVMLVFTEHGLLTKVTNQIFTNNTYIADSGATCQMRGSLEGMFHFKTYVTDIMVGYNESMTSVSKGDHKRIVLQKDDTLWTSLYKMSCAFQKSCQICLL